MAFIIFIFLAPWFLFPLILFLFYNLENYFFLKASTPKSNANGVDEEFIPMISVIIAAHNEEKNIQQRIKNVLDSYFPKEKIQIVVGSDGSNDRTCEIVKEVSEQFDNVSLFQSKAQIGRANIHNECVRISTGDILIFTDADTQFDPKFLKHICNEFRMDDVGYVNGELVYINTVGSKIVESSSIFWKFELWLRRIETRLSIYAFGTGACCAVRKTLYKPIDPIGDVDFTTPIDVVIQGYKCIHSEKAIAYDSYPDTDNREFNARIRITSKNLAGTLSRWGWKNYFLHPIYSVVIFGHKILRWFFPVLFILHVAGSLMVEDIGLISHIINFSGGLFILFALLYIITGKKVKFFGYFHSFCLVNVAFLIGITRVLLGKVQIKYKPVNQIDS